MTTTTTTTTRTYTLPIQREAEFLARTKKTPKVFQPFALIRKGEHRDLDTGRTLVTYEWSGPSFAIKEGWTLAARVEWVEGKGASAVFVGGPEAAHVAIPEAPTCDHCKAKRHRSKTYVALATDGSGKTLTLGGDCAKLFWGMHLKYLPFWEEMELFATAPDDDMGMGGGHVVKRFAYDVRTVLALAIPHIRTFGYVPSSSDAVPTKWKVDTLQRALDLWGPGPVTVPVESRPEDLKGIDNVEMASDEEVDRLIEWAAAQHTENPDSTYWRTVSEALANGWFAPRVLGFIVALPHGFSKRALTPAPAPTYRHVGIEGERMKTPMKLTVLRTNTFETVYGMTTLTILRDEDGNTLKSFGKMPRELREEGDTAPVTFFVKAHGEYKGMPETIINRVS